MFMGNKIYYFVVIYLLLVKDCLSSQQCFYPIPNTPSLEKLSQNLTSSTVIHPKDAADIVMNTFYQNCEASSLPPYNILKLGEMRGYQLEKHPWNGGSVSKVVNHKEALNSQYYINCPHEDRKACINLCAQPPTYIWGGKGVYEKNGTLDLFSNDKSIQEIAHHPGIDCSGFINAVFAVSGLKVRPDMSPSKVAFTTDAKWFMKPGKCFESVPIDTPFKPGDIISWEKHVVMVDQCAKDPFGLAKLKDVSQCTSEYLDPLNFKLIVSNSVGGVNDINQDGTFTPADLHGGPFERYANIPITGVGIGVSKVSFGQLALKYPTEIMELAKAACYAKFNKPFKHSKINVTRHILSNKKPMPSSSPCMENLVEKPKLKGLECILENCGS